jgi:hypothetical protein
MLVTKYDTLLVYMVEDIVAAGFSKDLVGSIASDFFCAPIPICDDPVAV